jgi:ATP-binding cassette subfamily C protein
MGWGLGLVAATLVVWLVSQAVAAHVAHGVDADLCGDLRRRLLAHLGRVPLDWFSHQGQDGVARLADQDVRALHQLVAHAPNDLSNLVVVPVAALLCLAWLQPALLVFCLLPLAMAAGGFALMRSAVYREDVARRNAALEQLSADYGEFAHNLPLARQYPGAGVQGGVEVSADGFETAFSAWVGRVGSVGALIQLVLGTPWLMAWGDGTGGVWCAIGRRADVRFSSFGARNGRAGAGPGPWRRRPDGRAGSGGAVASCLRPHAPARGAVKPDSKR